MIAIIIVGYNSKRYLDDCLSSIFESNYNKFNVIFVDNNSTDGSVEYIEKKFPKVVILKNKLNEGFAKGNNIGFKKAEGLGSEYILILNPDTVMDQNCLKILASEANNRTVLQPLLLLYENNRKTNLINTTGNYLNFLGFSYCNNYKKPAINVKKETIPLASGAAAFIPIRAIRETCGFDEHFFMYHEDVDLFWRMRIAGYNIGLVPEAKIWHKYSFTKNKDKMFYVERNRLLFIYKNFSSKYLLLITPIFIINELIVLLYSIITGWFLIKIKSYGSFILLLKKIHRSRNNKNYSEYRLLQFIGNEVSFLEFNTILNLPYNAILNLYWKVFNLAYQLK